MMALLRNGVYNCYFTQYKFCEMNYSILRQPFKLVKRRLSTGDFNTSRSYSRPSKLRYIVLGSAICGSIALKSQFKKFWNVSDTSFADDVHLFSFAWNVKNAEKVVELNAPQWSSIDDILLSKFRYLIGLSDYVFYFIPKVLAATSTSSPGKTPTELREELMALQLRYQRELERLEKENRELRKQNIILRQGSRAMTRRAKPSLIEMYSAVLDELAGWPGSADQLPRVVVVGDQSAGKTSVLEMIAEARIFPRGSGEMMTRAPVKVTLSEGPYRVAKFHDTSREFDLTKEADLVELRKEVEIRMRNSVRGGRTVSSDVIAMSVRGPGLPRMVLVDLPGIISTQTMDMASDTRESIKKMTKTYIDNPNAIILCIQDGSVDAERSNVTDLVMNSDPTGKRTVFVLTKVDLAEENLADPDRIHKILSGKLFPMKALGYYAVVTGRGRRDDTIEDIREYEEHFFRNSRLFRDGTVSPTQATTRNLSLAVADRFWKMVKDTIEQQADSFKALRFNLETEWKNSYPRLREMDRSELFERARTELLDKSAELSQISARRWETLLLESLWSTSSDYAFDQVYLPASTASGAGEFNTTIDIALRRWAEGSLPEESVKCGREVLYSEFLDLLKKSRENEERDNAFDKLEDYAARTALSRHHWEERAIDVLRVLQLNTLQDRVVSNRNEWDTSVTQMENTLKDRINQANAEIKELLGPGATERWLRWKYISSEQVQRSAVRQELERLLNGRQSPELSPSELSAIHDTLLRNGVLVDKVVIQSTWQPIYQKYFLQQALSRAQTCRKSFYFHQQVGSESEMCYDVVLFWRLHQVMKTTSKALRQQIVNREATRLDKELKDTLDELAGDSEQKQSLLTGRRVDLAEELKRVRRVQEQIEEFIQALRQANQ